MDKLVSIIVPTYNVENYLDQCMQCLLNQTYPHIEIILCDDCSTDATREVLEKYKALPNIKVLYNQKNMRQAATRNRCIAEAAGDYIMVQDADDLCALDRVEKLMAALEDGVDFVGSSCYCFDETCTFDVLRGRREYPVAKDLWWGIPFVHASILFRKAALEAVEGYRISKVTARGEDYDLIMRMYAAGLRGKNIPDQLYGYRVDRATIARRTFRARLDECVIRYQGYRANQILLPLGWLFVLKPIPAHFLQVMKNLKGKK